MLKKKLIVFGGSFDPIHNGHIKIAKRAFKKIKADKLFFVPCNNHPHDKRMSASNEDRLNMLKLGIQGYPRFEICDFEIKRNEISYSIDTINYFKEYYSDYQIYLLVGYDQLLKFKKWHKYEEILEKAKIICHKRNAIKELKTKDKQDKNDNQNIEELDSFLEHNKKSKNDLVPHISIGMFFMMNISSSEIRINPKKRHLNPMVLKYINDNGIYAVDRLREVMSEYRFNHSLRVAQLAVDIAKALKYYPLLKQAYVAGIYHDYAKEFDKEVQESFWTKFKLKYFNYPSWKVIHAPLGAYEIKKRFFIDDIQVLTAIKNHTILEDNSTLSKIIYCADKLDIRKDGQLNNAKKILEVCKKDLDTGLSMINKELNKIGHKE